MYTIDFSFERTKQEGIQESVCNNIDRTKKDQVAVHFYHNTLPT